LAAGAGFAGWYFGTQGGAGGASPSAADATETAAEERADPTTVDVGSPAPQAQGTAASGASSVAQEADNENKPKPPEETRTATITNGRLIIDRPSWTEEMKVRLGRDATSRPLDRKVAWNLKPGRYQVVFEISVNGYRAERTVPVSIGEAARRKIEVPIAEPGGLSVRPQLGRPQGEVLIDGLPKGPSPLRELWLAPGSYSVEVQPRGGGESLRQQVELKSGSLAVLTFDLEAGTIKRTDKPLN